MTNSIELQKKMPIVKQILNWAKQVWWEPSVLKRNKLAIKIGENKNSINESYLCTQFIPHLLVPLLIIS